MPAVTTPLVSVIVVSYNRAEDLRLCLSAIAQTGYPSLELIVVDNASTDTAVEVAESFLGARIVRNAANMGFAGANNQGLALARGQYLALINNDAVVAPDYFRRMVAFLESRPDCAAAGGKAYFWDDTRPVGDRRNSYYSYTIVDANTARNTALTDTPDGVREVATLSGCAVMVRRQAILETRGGFLDPFFFTYYEETDFFARALRQGWKMYYTGEPAVWHRVRTDSAELSYDYQFYMERNRFLFAWRNFDQSELGAFHLSLSNKIRRERLRDLMRLVVPTSAKRRAHRDARHWYRTHRPFLEEQRRSLAGFPRPYNRTVGDLQAREMGQRPGGNPVGGSCANAPLVSIVIANYNYGRFLPEAIESALSQSHQPVEVIVVDDGSHDNSIEVARRYPVRVIAQTNQGVSAARNRGAAECTGSFIMFLDADDVLEANYIETCLQALAAAPPHVAYAYTGMRYFGAEARVWGSRPFVPRTLLRWNYVHASALIRHGVFRESGGFDTRWRLGHEDYELWIRLLKMGHHGVLVPEPLLRYRRHDSSRNTLTKAQVRRLKWQLRIAYPSFYWADFIKYPFAAIYWALFLRRQDPAG